MPRPISLRKNVLISKNVEFEAFLKIGSWLIDNWDTKTAGKKFPESFLPAGTFVLCSIFKTMICNDFFYVFGEDFLIMICNGFLYVFWEDQQIFMLSTFWCLLSFSDLQDGWRLGAWSSCCPTSSTRPWGRGTRPNRPSPHQSYLLSRHNRQKLAFYLLQSVS